MFVLFMCGLITLFDLYLVMCYFLRNVLVKRINVCEINYMKQDPRPFMLTTLIFRNGLQLLESYYGVTIDFAIN